MSLRTITARTGLALACALSLGLGLACGGGGGSKTPSPIITTPAATPSFTTPASQTVTVGGNATFTVNATVTDGGTLSYQWTKAGAAIGTNSKNLAFNPVALTDAGTYRVTVTNTLNGDTANAKSVTSGDITLTVNPVAVVAATPSFTTPASQTVTVGGNATFTVDATVTDGGTLSYQWTKAGATVGTNSKNLAFNPVALTDAGTYRVTVTNTLNGDTANAKSATSGDITLTVTEPTLQITQDLASTEVTVPDGATFTVKATTTTGKSLHYTWKRTRNNLDDTTFTPVDDSPTLTIPATDLRNVADAYTVTITDGVTTLTSSAATLTVKAPRPVYAGDPTQNLGHAYKVLSSKSLDAPADPLLGSFRVGYDSTMLNPAWSAACFFPIMGNFTNTRPKNYTDDTDRVTPSALDADYKGSPYSRGHQTGYSDLATRYGQAAGNSTMYMTNMCPQTQYLNGGVWVALASVLNGGLDSDTGLPVVSFSNSFGRVWIYTGPIFADKLMNPIGTNKVQIPSAFYNIVVRETEVAGGPVGTPKVLALITPHNCSIYDTALDHNGNTVGYRALDIADCWKLVTTVDRVQALTGLNFFPNASTLPAGFTSTVDVRGWGTTLENGIGKPNVHMIEPSWDSTFSLGSDNTIVKIKSGTVNQDINFVAQATPSSTTTSPIASTTWSFGDGTTATTPSRPHAYSAAGDYVVTFTAKDEAGASNSVTRVITVFDPALPTISALASVNTNNTTPKSVTFTVADGDPAAAPLSVTAASSDTSVLANPLTVTKTSDGYTLTLTPVAGSMGTSTVTITATNASGKTATRTFTFNVFPLFENFTQASAVSSYATGTYTLSTGPWAFTSAMSLIGDWSDAKNERQGLRMKAGTESAVAMKFDIGNSSTSISSVSVAYAVYLTDAKSGKTATFSLQYANDGATATTPTWKNIGDPVTATSNELSTKTFDCSSLGLVGPIRFRIVVDKSSAARLNLDDFKVQ